MDTYTHTVCYQSLTTPELNATVENSSPTTVEHVSKTASLSTAETVALSTTSMTDEQALFQAQRIWGPRVSLERLVSFGFFRRQNLFAMLWLDDERTKCVGVASVTSYSSLDEPPASWESLFASVQEVAK